MKIAAFADDVHAKAGLSCQDCHGGNPAAALAEDSEGAMARGFKANPFRGAPDRKATPGFCARCHSDPAYMKRFNPGARVDQEREYWTSQHGQALRKGDDKVATCKDCHGAHGIKAISDPRSPVYPTQVAETCRGCHESPERMQGHKLKDGRAISLGQYAGWRQSVHAHALLDKGDLSAPTCNDCHGNHGATPPGLESIAAVCGQCHGREAQLFRASRKHAGFQDHAKLLADAGGKGRAACHDAPPGIAHAGPEKLSECVSCHGNHGVMRPTVALLAPLPSTPCAFCHEGPEAVADSVGEPGSKRRSYEKTRDGLLEQGRALKLDVDGLFDWLVDAAVMLPPHTRTNAEGGGPERRPEFARLFSKFRIGKTYHSLDDAKTGLSVRSEVVRCTHCHVNEPRSAGFKTAGELLTSMRELTALTGRSERVLLAARRGGVETRQALLDLDHAVDAQIELEVLVHGFSTAKDSAFVKKQKEGIGHARAALAAGQQALAELQNRRKGLMVSSVVIHGHPVGAFEVSQAVAALTLGFGGGAQILRAHGASGALLAAAAVVLGGLAYAVAFAFVERRFGQAANFYFYSTAGGLLTLVGCTWLRQAPVWIFSGLALAAAWFGCRYDRQTLRYHSVAYLLAGASTSGLLSLGIGHVLGRELIGDGLPSLSAWLALAATLATYGVLAPGGPGDAARARIPQAIAAALLVLGLQAALVGTLSAVTGAAESGPMLATIRTGMLAALSLGVAEAGCRFGKRELEWLVYPMLALGGLKLLMEDLPSGRAATLSVSFLLYGTALTLAPRLARAGRGRN